MPKPKRHKSKSELFGEVLRFNTTKARRAQIEEAAKLRGKILAHFMRDAVEEATETILSRQSSLLG